MVEVTGEDGAVTQHVIAAGKRSAVGQAATLGRCAADASVLVVQNHPVDGSIDAVYRASREAGRIGTVHADIEMDRSPGLPSLVVKTRRRFMPQGMIMLVLAGGDTGVAIDAAFRIAEKYHTRHGRALGLDGPWNGPSGSRQPLAKWDCRPPDGDYASFGVSNTVTAGGVPL